MPLDHRTCSQARRTRDPRFDGRIFIAVLTTGVYCRPICPSPTSKEKNVRYFETAAAAAEAGFRPCFRCRPECSPGTPAWMGTSATVSRALRLISESRLEDDSVDALASRLGVGARHLRRLFVQHLGASPNAVTQTRRLHFAKKLIDETALPMKHLALAAGFGSVRRFNAAIRKVYRRTPTQIRKLVPQLQMQPEHEYVFRLRFRPPMDWHGMLAFLAPRATPGVEVVEQGCYRRTISVNGSNGCVEASLEQARDAIAVRIHFEDARWLFLIVDRMRRMFDLNADPFEIAAHLGADSLLAKHLALHPGLRVPGCWDGFELAVRAILAMRAFGEPDAFPSADRGLMRAASMPSPWQLEKRSRAWRPWRAYAAMLLWRGTGKEEGAHPRPQRSARAQSAMAMGRHAQANGRSKPHVGAGRRGGVPQCGRRHQAAFIEGASPADGLQRAT